MNKKMLASVLGGLMLGSVGAASAQEEKAPAAEKTKSVKKGHAKKGAEKSCAGDKKGGDKSCGGDKQGGDKSCGGEKAK